MIHVSTTDENPDRCSPLPTPFAASAASPEDDYIAARDKFIAQFTLKEGAEIDAQTTAAEERARAELETRLRQIIGPSGVSAAPAQGKSNLETLITGDGGLGKLDALNLEMKGTAPRSLRRARCWRAGSSSTRTWWNDNNVPQELDAALQSESFYTQAISTGASVARFAELPLTRPAGTGFADAMLVMQRQDIGAGTPHDRDRCRRARRARVHLERADRREDPCDADLRGALEARAREIARRFTRSTARPTSKDEQADGRIQPRPGGR